MTKQISTPQNQAMAAPLIAAARQGAAQQIERMKAMLSEIRAQRTTAEGEQDEQPEQPAQQPSNSQTGI